MHARWLFALFLAALVFAIWATTFGWDNETFQGNEYRETQTAISAFHIQRDHDFSLAYPTPILGKPWSVPMEFPLYQWTVVLLSNAAHLPLQESGRLVSMICFFLSLPAIYLLLRRLGLRPALCLAPLSLILTCPLYVFYARAFLIETMALMFGLWYLVGITHGAGARNLVWLSAASVAGIAAGLVKVTTFIVFLTLGFVFCLGLLWRLRPHTGRPGWSPLVRVVGWLAAAHAIPFAATLWWIRLADSVKALNPTGFHLRSDQLHDWNFGFSQRFLPETWLQIWQHFQAQIVWPPVLFLAAVVGALFVRRSTWMIVLLCGIYLTMMFVFPVLYAVHPYYHVAAAVLPVAAIGLVIAEIGESPRLPRFVAPLLLAAMLAGQIWSYARTTYPLYERGGNRGSLAAALEDVLRPYECLIVAGDDWSSILPYYAQRRALLIRARLSSNPEYLHAAFSAMRGEEVGALVLFDFEQNNSLLRDMAVQAFNLEPEPAMTWDDRGRHAVVYFNRTLAHEAMVRVHQSMNRYHRLELAARPASPNPLAGHELELRTLPRRHQDHFAGFTPRPARFFCTFGPASWGNYPADWRFSVHPNTTLWFDLAAGRHHLRTDLIFSPDAWENVPANDATDGVEVTGTLILSDGQRQDLHRRRINPAGNPADRGTLPIDWSFDMPAGARFEFSVTPGPASNFQRDWVSLGTFRIEPWAGAASAPY